MKRAVSVLLVLIASIACDLGPLPPTPPPNATAPDVRRLDGFPTSSTDDFFPLDFAIRNGRLEEAKRLLEEGANPNLRWGQSGDHFPLEEVLEPGYSYNLDRVQAVRLLLQHGADPNAKWCPFESRGPWELGPSCIAAKAMTPLIFATIASSTEIVDLLLDAGADPTPRNWHNGSALDYADDAVIFEKIARIQFPDLSSRDLKSLEWLREYDGNIRGNPWESTPLATAVSSYGYYMMRTQSRALNRVQILMRIGADPNQRAQRGADWTPVARRSVPVVASW